MGLRTGQILICILPQPLHGCVSLVEVLNSTRLSFLVYQQNMDNDSFGKNHED